MPRLFAALLSIVLTTAVRTPDRKPPFFGNGLHNGWADATSVVLWTRLTRLPDMRETGPRFLVPDPETHRALATVSDEAALLRAQVPAGAKLDDMAGACPGAPGQVRLTYFPAGKPDQRRVLPWAEADAARNFTRQWHLTNLRPGTRYTIRLEARADAHASVSDTLTGAFATPPAAGSASPVKFCVVSCHDYNRRDTALGHKIYAAMRGDAPDFYVHTGDIEYYDRPSPYALTEALMRFKWDRLFALPLQRRFWNQTTTYFQKDDHDVLSNDAYPGRTYGAVTYERGLELFDREQFPTRTPTYQTVRWGRDLQIWLLEGRNYRGRNTDPDGPAKTVLGPVQKRWLRESLAQSTATFKLIVTPTPILGPDRGNKNDNLANEGFVHEGDEIRALLNGQKNVYICNGDRHWQYVTHEPGTRLWEFGCGPGSDSHAGGWKESDVLPEHRFLRVKGGYLRGSVFRAADGSPRLRFEHCDVDGRVVHREEFNPE